MFITNFEKIEQKILCEKKIADYLISKGIPVLGIQNTLYCFSETEKVKKLITEAIDKL